MTTGQKQNNSNRDSDTIDRRTAIKATLTTAAAAGASFQPRVLGFVEPRKNLSGEGNGIFSFTPTRVTECSGIQISGRGFGLEAQNMLVFTSQGMLHNSVVFADDQRVLTRVDLGREELSATLHLQVGVGAYATPLTLTGPLQPHGRYWAWRSNGTGAYSAARAVTYVTRPNLPAGALVYRGHAVANSVRLDLTLPLNDDCCPQLPQGTFTQFFFQARNPADQSGIACSGAFFFEEAVDALHLAEAVVSVLRATLRSMLNRDAVISIQQNNGPDDVTVVVSSVDGVVLAAGDLSLRLNTLDNPEPCGSIEQDSVPGDSFGSFSVQGAALKGSVSVDGCSVPSQQCPSIPVDFPDFLFN